MRGTKRILLGAAWAVIMAGVSAGGVFAQGASTATGVSNLLNPAVSINALFLGETSRDIDDAEANRIDLQEAELRFTAVVDPFWQADMTVAIHPEHGHEEGEGGGHYAVDLEEAFVRARQLPAGLGLRLGKFYLPFGKQVPLHTHQYAFVRAPVGVTSLLGEHAPAEVGAELAWNVPLPWWSELTAYAVNGDAGIFDAEDRDLVFGARWSQMWDVSDDATYELGLSALHGPAADPAAEDPDLDLVGLDLTLKWISSAHSHGPALTWTSEVVLRPQEGGDDPQGFSSQLQYRLLRNWWAAVGFSLADSAPWAPDAVVESFTPGPQVRVAPSLREYKVNATYAPSEFSFLRGEVSYLHDPDEDFEDLRVSLQWTFTIGSHPAHLY